MTFLDALGKKMIGMVHTPTKISFLKDEILDRHATINYLQNQIKTLGFEIQELERQIDEVQRKWLESSAIIVARSYTIQLKDPTPIPDASIQDLIAR